MARLQNTAIVGSINYLIPQREIDQYYGMQNLAEEEALKRHEEEKKKENK